MHDRHSKCIACLGNECSLENHCSEFMSWSDDVMTEYVKHRKSLDLRVVKVKDRIKMSLVCIPPLGIRMLHL